MADIIINIAKDFSRCPGARYPEEGNYSGKEFREQLLSPKLTEAIETGARLVIILDGSAGYATSFIEEVFGGLIRENKYTLEEILGTLNIISEEDPSYIEDAKIYMRNAWAHNNK